MSEEATLDEFVEESEKPEVSEPTVPDSWRVTRADELMEITRGASPRPKGDPELFGGDIPWVKIGDVDVKNARYTGDTEDTVTEKGAKKSKLVDSGTLLVSNSGTCGYPMFAGVQSCVHDGWLILRNYEDILNPHYLYEYIGWKQNYLKSLAPGSTQINLNTSRMGVLEINIPPLPEQRKIATVLSTVDRAIEKTGEIIEQSERLRTGVMQDLFSTGVWNHDEFQETQYGNVPAEWEVETIDEISSHIGSGGTPSTDEDAYYGGEIAWVKTDDLNSGLVETTKTTITEKGLNESAAKLFPKGTVVFAMYGGSLGQNGRLGMEATMNQACCGIVADESKIDPYFLHQHLIHRKQQLTALSAGTHQQNISQSMIEKFEVFVPSLEEQSEMIEILQDIETMIVRNDRQREQLQRLKQGLQQDLLSGTVRTTDTKIQVPDKIAQHG